MSQNGTERYWLCAPEGAVLLGPFKSQDLAIKVRVYVEKIRGREDVWVQTDEDLARASRRFKSAKAER